MELGRVRRLAASAPVRVFAVSGTGARRSAATLRLADRVALQPGPRAANILLLVGDLPPATIAPALVAHDALAAPRATAAFPTTGEGGRVVAENFPGAVTLDGDLEAGLVRLHADLFLGRRKGETAFLPDVEPVPWRGVGPYGQGGTGMTGGTPYGRPLPDRADDRDGLKLDQLPVRIGPLFPAFPPGLVLDVRMQGDLIQEVAAENAFDGAPGARPAGRPGPEAVTVRDLEMERVRSHLLWLSSALVAHGLPALAERTLRLVDRARPGDVRPAERLERAIARSGVPRWFRGVGRIPSSSLDGVAGPVARASGRAVDARSEDDTYLSLGFEPVVQRDGDVAARWLQRVREIRQALQLAGDAGAALAGEGARREGPRGPSLLHLLPDLLVDQEWGDAVATVVSLDLDMEHAARAPHPVETA